MRAVRFLARIVCVLSPVFVRRTVSITSNFDIFFLFLFVFFYFFCNFAAANKGFYKTEVVQTKTDREKI